MEASSIMLTLEIRRAEICLTQLRLKVKKEYFLTEQKYVQPDRRMWMIQQGIFMSVTAVRFDSSYLGPFKTFANITNLATILLKLQYKSWYNYLSL